MEGATESEKNALQKTDEKKSVQFEDLDGTGATQNPEGGEKPGVQLDPEKSKTVFMNLINVDEKAQVSSYLNIYLFV